MRNQQSTLAVPRRAAVLAAICAAIPLAISASPIARAAAADTGGHGPGATHAEEAEYWALSHTFLARKLGL